MRLLFRIPAVALLAAAIVFLFALEPGLARAGEGLALSAGQTIYLPVYSHIYYGDKGRKINLAVTLSLRNTDPENPVTLLSADYFDPNGKIVKKFIDQPLALGPLSSTRFLVAESDPAGGSGAGLVVTWKSQAPVNPLLAQSVMIGAEANQGISFVCDGRVLKETP
ncbi:MAG: DUF3124 domain-containing protein [Pseudomonadota bacterium]